MIVIKINAGIGNTDNVEVLTNVGNNAQAIGYLQMAQVELMKGRKSTLKDTDKDFAEKAVKK